MAFQHLLVIFQWDYLVEISYDTLDKMEDGTMIDLNFEGYMIIEQSDRTKSSCLSHTEWKKKGRKILLLIFWRKRDIRN